MTRPLHIALTAALGCAGLAGLATAREPSQASTAPPSAQLDIIETLTDVLPQRLVERMPAGLDSHLVGRHPLLLLVNPQLKGGGPTPLATLLALEGTELPAALLEVLGEQGSGRKAPVHWQLERVFRDYLRLVFAQVDEGDDLLNLVQHKRALHTSMFVMTVDAWLGVQDERIVVRVVNRLWRLELAREAPFPVDNAELLYSDRARGDAPLPERDRAGRFEERALFAAYRAAIIDAIRGQLAVSLWGNPALREHSWRSRRPDPIGSGANGSTPPGLASGAGPLVASSGSSEGAGRDASDARGSESGDGAADAKATGEAPPSVTEDDRGAPASDGSTGASDGGSSGRRRWQ